MRGFLTTLATVVALSGGVLLAQDATKIDSGKKIYDVQKCNVCHAIAGKGNKMFPLDGVGAKVSVEDLRKWLTATAEMEDKLQKKPALKMSSKKLNLKDADVDALVAYLQTLK